MRLFVLNFAGACFLIWAWWTGLIRLVTEADAVGMVYIIAAVFLVGVVSTFRQAHLCASPTAETDSAHLHDIYHSLFLLAIIGNAIGILMAFREVGIDSLTTADGIRKAGALMLAGVGTAFGSTIAGLSLALWTMVNLRVLATMQDRAHG